MRVCARLWRRAVGAGFGIPVLCGREAVFRAGGREAVFRAGGREAVFRAGGREAVFRREMGMRYADGGGSSMTTETVRDPVIEAWSDDLEEGLVEVGMHEEHARAYRLAFELGLTRVISQTATRQELQDGLAQGRQELQDGLAQGRQELHEGLAQVRGEMGELRGEMGKLGDQLRAEMKEMGDQLRAEMKEMGGQLRAEMKEMGGQLRAEMKGIQDQLQREMDLRFGELQKRLNLMTWAIGLGFAGMFGMMTAILVRL